MCDAEMCDVMLPDDFEEQLDQIKDCGDLLDDLKSEHSENGSEKPNIMQYKNNVNQQVQNNSTHNQTGASSFPTIEDLIDQYVKPEDFQAFEEIEDVMENPKNNGPFLNQKINHYTQ